ncbi:unnamed protein product [Mucor fragilis]
MSKKSFNLDSFYQLLKGRVFHNIDYQSWLLECMKNAALPIHAKFGPVINEFVLSTFLTDQCQRIPENVVEAYFEDCSTISTSQILMLLYILTFNDYIIAFKTEPKLMSMNNAKEQKAYSVDLLDRIPIRFILNHVESYQNGNAYKSIYSDLLALSANLYPELFDIQSFLIQEGKDSAMDSLWHIKTVYRDWKKNLTTAELEQLLSQWETNVSTVVDGMSVCDERQGDEIFMP